MASYIMKFGLFSSKNGIVNKKEVYNESGKLVGTYTGETKDGKFHGDGSTTTVEGSDFHISRQLEGWQEKLAKGKRFMTMEIMKVNGEMTNVQEKGK